jgi:Rrf2 family protein
MPLISRKGLLAVAAVVDIALNARGRPVSAGALAARHGLPARHLEPVLQALVREGILKGVRGPRGGYELARERRRVTAEEIVRVAGAVHDGDGAAAPVPALLEDVVLPAVSEAERAFSAALARITIADLVRRAEAASQSAGRSAEGDFTI